MVFGKEKGNREYNYALRESLCKDHPPDDDERIWDSMSGVYG